MLNGLAVDGAAATDMLGQESRQDDRWRFDRTWWCSVQFATPLQGGGINCHDGRPSLSIRSAIAIASRSSAAARCVYTGQPSTWSYHTSPKTSSKMTRATH